MRNKIHFRLYLSLHLRDIPEGSYIALSTHALCMMSVWFDRSIMIGALFGEQCSFSYLAFHWTDFPGTSHVVISTHAPQNCEFRLDRSIMKGTLLGEQSTFCSVSRLPSQLFRGWVVRLTTDPHLLLRLRINKAIPQLLYAFMVCTGNLHFFKSYGTDFTVTY